MSFTLHEGETLAIVGESGSGKSVSLKSHYGILAENGRMTDGSITYIKENGEEIDLAKLSERNYHQIRGKEISDGFSRSYDVIKSHDDYWAQIMERIMKHQMHKNEAKVKTVGIISLVGITWQKNDMKQYPHEFSGGMSQRIVIAIAFACNPHFLICDEPTTALDVTIQAQILQLIKDLQKKMNTSVIYITHDLGVVANVADRVAVMYAGHY